eukprot:TRINITY_DN20895_c0_g1_i1.p1 TRINITY_DN20895_c0_g1~~TRINITY_DN20895_c0_g1_i1.p1  ORF type:complete len:424 (-),score=73.53 TRINITY_DN20895_c0_g1_i1:102-1271(-)
MGKTQSTHIDVRIMDRKSLVKEQCLKRKPHLESLRHAYRLEDARELPICSSSMLVRLKKASCRDPSICSGGENSCVWMEQSILPTVIDFLFGGALVRSFEVCPLWYVVLYKTLDRVFAKIDEGFKYYYGNTLHLEYARTDWSPVHVSEAGLRIDRILIARVTRPHANWCTKVSYLYRNKTCGGGNEDPAQQVECSFKFDAYQKYSKRSMWIHKDICRFHGDETRVAATQNIAQVCVEDRIEIPINMYNATGLIDVDTFEWKPLELLPQAKRKCRVELELFDWYDLDTFQSQSVERLQVPDFFGPQLVHQRTEYAGIDVAVSRTRLQAEAEGIVPQADRILGSRFEVLPASSPIILPLKRVGLQHDRFTKIQLRQGDKIDLYISQGGKMT